MREISTSIITEKIKRLSKAKSARDSARELNIRVRKKEEKYIVEESISE